MQIHKTTNYSQFKKMEGNRKIYQGHLNRLIDSIKGNNLLAYNPIICNSSLEVVDGQHRLEAAKKLNCEIYYVILPGGNLSEVQLLNTHAKNWSMDEFMESYVKKGFKDYKYLKAFAESHDFTVANSLAILSGFNGKTHGQKGRILDFKSGNFVVVDREKAEAFADAIEKLEPYLEQGVKNDRDFIFGLQKALSVVTIGDLITKAEESGWKIDRHVVAKDYIRRIEDIINYNMKKNHTRLF